MTKQELQTLLGKNMRKARMDQKLTIEQTAEKIGISIQFYSNLECGNKMMSIVTLRKLADALYVSTDSLLYDDVVDQRIKSLTMLLCGLSEEDLVFVEKMIRLCIDELPGRKNTEGVTAEDECGTE